MRHRESIHLRGMTWNHHRGIAPIEAVSETYAIEHAPLSLSWDARPLKDFESQPIRELAQNYDLLIIDHPHLGEAVAEGLLVDLSVADRAGELDTLARNSVGRSHQSYQLGDGQYALAVDAATAVACYRPDRITVPPAAWGDVMVLAREGLVGLPLLSPHALMAFFWLAHAQGYRPASTPDALLPDDQMKSVLELFRQLSDLIPQDCYNLDPITFYDWMADGEDAPAYCVHGYGYISYARAGFRPNSLTFTDIATFRADDYRGTVLGGTGIAVSALSDHIDRATDFAFDIASQACQSGPWVSNGGQPGHRHAWLDSTCNAQSGDFMKNTLRTLDGAWVRPRYAGYLPFQTAASVAITDYLRGHSSMTETITCVNRLYRESRSS